MAQILHSRCEWRTLVAFTILNSGAASKRFDMTTVITAGHLLRSLCPDGWLHRSARLSQSKSSGRRDGRFHVQLRLEPGLRLNPQRTTEPPGGIVRLRTVVIKENSVEAAITKEGAAEFSDGRRRSHPARRFRVEISQCLQLSILFFRQKFNADCRRHAHGAIFWLIFFP